PKMTLSVNKFGAGAMLPLMWLILRTMPGGAGGGPGAPGAVTLMMLPAETNSPLIPARDCTRNAPLTMTLELLLLEVPVVMLVLLLALLLLLLELLLPASLVVRPDGSSRSWICVSGPTELRFRLAMPDSTSMVPPAIRLNLGRLIVLNTLAPMPLRLLAALLLRRSAL